ncbi:MAG: glycosyltransferase, partial [Nitrospirales bacterium]|nr:glycosyltransferase [Nitrospirales bacterium]
MRILLINTPSLATRPISRSMAGGLGFDGHESMLLPPLDLALMAATLRNAHETVEIIDADALGLDKDAVYHRIAGQNWDVILGTASLATIYEDANFLAKLKKTHPTAKIVGKTLVRDHEVLKGYLQTSGADFIIHGEADLNILQLLQGRCRSGTAWLEPQNASSTPGFRFEEGTPIPNLDELPFAAYDLLPYSAYRYPLLGAPVATLQTSRGCPFPCGYYCPYPLVEGVKWRAQSPERIFRELKEIVEGLGVKKVYFRDATFTLNQGRVHKLCEMVIQEKLRFEWVCETRVDCLSDDLLEIMKAAGCLGLLIGVETGDERIMHEKEGKKGLTLPKLAHVREKTLQLGMRLHFLLIVGLPQETRESLVSTYDLIFRYEPDTVGITLITPYPGTPLFKEGTREGWIESLQWEQYGGHQIVMHTPHLSAQEIVQGKRFLDEGVAILHKRRIEKISPELDAYSAGHYEALLRWAYGLDGPIALIHSKVLPESSREVSEPTTDLTSTTTSHGDNRSTISHPFISVLIPTFNRKSILRKTLLGLASQTLAPEKFEVIVVDDGSSDDTMEMLQKWKAPFALRVFPQTHGGPNVARNLALKQAQGWIVLFTGDDMIPGPSFLEAHLKFHLNHRDSLKGMIGFIDWSPEILITPFMRFLTSPEGGHQFSFHLVKDGKADFRLFYTSNISLKRELLTLEPGPFDIDFTYPAYDDIELGFRLANRGMQLYFNPQAVTYHHHEIRLTSYVERQKNAGGMAWILSQKHPQITQFLPLKELTEPNIPTEEELNKLLEIAVELEKPVPEKLGQLSINGLPFDQVYARNILFPVYSKLLYSAQCFGAKQALGPGGATEGGFSPLGKKPFEKTQALPMPVAGGSTHKKPNFSGGNSQTRYNSKVIAIPNDPVCGVIRLINPLVACRHRYKVDGEVIGEGKL